MKANINGIECLFYYDERIPQHETPTEYPFTYQIRHDEDDWCYPVSIEQRVTVNFFGTIFTAIPLQFNDDG